MKYQLDIDTLVTSIKRLGFFITPPIITTVNAHVERVSLTTVVELYSKF